MNALDSTTDNLPILEILDASFSWTPDSSAPPALKSISLNVLPRTLLGVVGMVGSGKSSLLLAILGEMDVLGVTDRLHSPADHHATGQDESTLLLPSPAKSPRNINSFSPPLIGSPLTPVVKLRGTVAYVSQQAWIMNATVRENIVFGKAFDAHLYSQVLDACGLRSDIDMLPGGDLTEIGERGINLSGGQKQRVSLGISAFMFSVNALRYGA